MRARGGQDHRRFRSLSARLLSLLLCTMGNGPLIGMGPRTPPLHGSCYGAYKLIRHSVLCAPCELCAPKYDEFERTQECRAVTCVDATVYCRDTHLGVNSPCNTSSHTACASCHATHLARSQTMNPKHSVICLCRTQKPIRIGTTVRSRGFTALRGDT